MIKPLTSLRFFFAFMVFTSHLSFLKNSKFDFLNWLYDSIFYEGYIGVSFFFILSGFILAYNYQEGMLNSQKSRKTFYQARFARIFPLHVLTFIISLPLSYKILLQHKTLWITQLITNLTLTQSFIPIQNIYFSFNAPSWSISDEMFFYVIFPFLIMLIPKIKRYKYFLLLLTLAIIPLLTLVTRSSFYHHIFYINPLIRVVDFIIGIFIFNFYKKSSFTKQNVNYTYLEISAILLLLLFFMFHQSIAEVARYSFYYWIPMSFLIFSFSFQKGGISNFLSKKIFLHLGEISFGFYLFHLLVLRYFNVLNFKFFHIENEIFIVFIVFAIALVVSHYSFIFFEKPMNEYIRKRVKK